MPISDGTTCRGGWHQSSAGLRYILYYIHHVYCIHFLIILSLLCIRQNRCVMIVWLNVKSMKPQRRLCWVTTYYVIIAQRTRTDHSNSSISISNMQHFISQREEFETARDGILVWLTEMDLQLTNIEHFSECDIQAKIKQLRVGLSQYFTFTQASSLNSLLYIVYQISVYIFLDLL